MGDFSQPNPLLNLLPPLPWGAGKRGSAAGFVCRALTHGWAVGAAAGAAAGRCLMAVPHLDLPRLARCRPLIFQKGLPPGRAAAALRAGLLLAGVPGQRWAGGRPRAAAIFPLPPRHCKRRSLRLFVQTKHVLRKKKS